MKKFLALTLLLVSSMAVSKVYADVIKLKAYNFAYRAVENGSWTDWSDWSDCNILVVLNTDKERLTIYSKETQEYDIISCDDWESDGKGGKVMEIQCIDAEGLRCNVRWRVDNEGEQQVYVDYNDVSFVYNVVNKDW